MSRAVSIAISALVKNSYKPSLFCMSIADKVHLYQNPKCYPFLYFGLTFGKVFQTYVLLFSKKLAIV